MYLVKEAATKEDLDRILNLRYLILRKPWNQSIESATDSAEADSINAFIINENGEAIACARLQENEGKAGQIRFMAVDNRYQGKGVGKLALEYLEERAKRSGLIKIELNARENAVKFYERCGYSIKEKSYLLWGQIQHYLMEKRL